MKRLQSSLLATLGAVCIAAAGAKAAGMAVMGDGEFGRWSIGAIVTAEMLLGLWLMNGWQAGKAWGALVCFVVFAGVATVKALAGAESCGCFGAIAVNPWYTAGFDWIAVAGLLGVRWLGGMGVWVSVAGW